MNFEIDKTIAAPGIDIQSSGCKKAYTPRDSLLTATVLRVYVMCYLMLDYCVIFLS